MIWGEGGSAEKLNAALKAQYAAGEALIAASNAFSEAVKELDELTAQIEDAGERLAECRSNRGRICPRNCSALQKLLDDLLAQFAAKKAEVDALEAAMVTAQAAFDAAVAAADAAAEAYASDLDALHALEVRYHDASSKVRRGAAELQAEGLFLAAETLLAGLPVLRGMRAGRGVGKYGSTPGGRPFTKHYGTDKGPTRNIPGSVVDETIRKAPGKPGGSGKTVHYDPENNVTVVTGDGGSIVSARKGPPGAGQR